MRIVLLGAPGSGKGTQSKLISEYFKIPHLSTGEVFRDNIKRKTDLGVLSMEYIDKGFLVPDSLTISLILERLNKCPGGFILDGFPRTLPQAFALGGVCQIDAVVNLVISDEVVAGRLSGRWTCACGAIYHESVLKSFSCIKCGQGLSQRSDDTHDAILNRLAIYHNQTEPLINYYTALNILKAVDANNDVENVFDSVKAALSFSAAEKSSSSAPTIQL